MKSIIMYSIRSLLVMTLLTGILYPLMVTVIGQKLFHQQANGSLIKVGDTVIGSELLAQKFTAQEYFWSRPSSSDYQTLPTGASNLGPTSQKLRDRISETLKSFYQETNIPYDLLFTSGSGLDPHLSPEGARFQLKRVAEKNGLKQDALERLVDSYTEPSQWGLLGRPRVNVLKLNLAIRDLKK